MRAQKDFGANVKYKLTYFLAAQAALSAACNDDFVFRSGPDAFARAQTAWSALNRLVKLLCDLAEIHSEKAVL